MTKDSKMYSKMQCFFCLLIKDPCRSVSTIPNGSTITMCSLPLQTVHGNVENFSFIVVFMVTKNAVSVFQKG